MGRPRKGQEQRPTAKFSVVAYLETVQAINAAADAKGLSRSAYVAQLLAKATKTTKRKEGE